MEREDLIGKSKKEVQRAIKAAPNMLRLLIARPGALTPALSSTLANLEDDEGGADMTSSHLDGDGSSADGTQVSAQVSSQVSNLQSEVEDRRREAEGLRARHRSLLEQNDAQQEIIDELQRQQALLESELGPDTRDPKHKGAYQGAWCVGVWTGYRDSDRDTDREIERNRDG